MLLAISNAPSCEPHYQQEFRGHAECLISVFSCIPDDQDVIVFIESSQVTENIFEAGRDALHRGCDNVARVIKDLLFDWSMKAGKYSLWTILERGLCGVAVLTLQAGSQEAEGFKRKLINRLATEYALSQEIRNRAADGIRDQIRDLDRSYYLHSPIQSAITQSERNALEPILEAIIEILECDLRDGMHNV